MTDQKALGIYSPMGEQSLSGLDGRLLTLASENPNISAEELAEKLGIESITPARARQMLRELLKGSALDDAMRMRLMLFDLIKLRDMLFEKVEGTEIRVDRRGNEIEVDADPRHASNLIRLLETYRKTILDIQTFTDAAENKLRSQDAKRMAQGYAFAIERLLRRLVEHGYEIPEKLAMELAEECLALAFQYLETFVDAE